MWTPCGTAYSESAGRCWPQLPDSERAANEAAAKVRIDYEVLPSVLDIEAALAPGAPIVNVIVSVVWDKTFKLPDWRFLLGIVFAAVGVDEQHVGVAGFAQRQRLAGADGHHVYTGVMFLLKGRQNGVEQAGVGRAGGGCQA